MTKQDDRDQAASVIDIGRARASRRRSPTFEGPDWLEDAVCDDKGRTLPILRNVALALRSAPEIAESFAFDELQMVVTITRELPLAEGAESRGVLLIPRRLTDADVSQVQEWLQSIGLPRVGVAIVHQAITLRAHERPFHPVRGYLEALKWDRRPRLDSWLSRYLGAEPTLYTGAIGALFLIASVARIFKPGCKVDYALILEGHQGTRKSSACAILGGPWFSDQLPDIKRENKDASQFLRRKWFIEIPELSALDKADSEALKTYISRQVEDYRPSYGRRNAFEPRQCVFIGTTNKPTYLRDETGGRRFWPVRVGNLDLAALTADRDQLFAEAVAAYRTRKPWWPDDDFERDYIRAEQDARFDADPWREPIADWLAARDKVTPGQVAREALKIEMPRLATSVVRRITSVLSSIGWIRSPKKDGAGNYPWLRP